MKSEPEDLVSAGRVWILALMVAVMAEGIWLICKCCCLEPDRQEDSNCFMRAEDPLWDESSVVPGETASSELLHFCTPSLFCPFYCGYIIKGRGRTSVEKIGGEGSVLWIMHSQSFALAAEMREKFRACRRRGHMSWLWHTIFRSPLCSMNDYVSSLLSALADSQDCSLSLSLSPPRPHFLCMHSCSCQCDRLLTELILKGAVVWHKSGFTLTAPNSHNAPQHRLQQRSSTRWDKLRDGTGSGTRVNTAARLLKDFDRDYISRLIQR